MGEVLIIHNVSRECGGKYECEADNKIGDIARRQMFIDVQCRYLCLISYFIFSAVHVHYGRNIRLSVIGCRCV